MAAKSLPLYFFCVVVEMRMMRVCLLFLLINCFTITVLRAQVLANFETPASTPALLPAGITSVAVNPDQNGNASNTVAHFQKPSGNWQAIYLNFATEKNVGLNDRLTFKLRSSTQGRVFVKIVKGSTTILEAWAPEYNFQPQPNVWTVCSLDLSSIENQAFDRIEVNASVDNTATANVYVDDFVLTHSLAANGQPIVEFQVSPYFVHPNTIPVNETIQFDASASFDTDGEIVAYRWNFGDGATAEGEHVTHTYTSSGVYWVSLVCEDNDGKQAVKKVSVSVLPQHEDFSEIKFSVNPKTYQKIEANFVLRRPFVHSYNPDTIKLDAIITLPDATTRTVPCFFYQSASYLPDAWKVTSGAGYWMVRFTTSQSGLHKIQIKGTSYLGESYESSVHELNVSAGTGKGFVKMDPDNRQYYRHTTGEPFYPQGINAAWDNTSNYTTIIKNLGNGGANVVRYWQVPFDRQGLEWKGGFYKGLGLYSQEAAAEQDSIMALCEANNVYLQITLFQHGMYSENVNSNWGDNPYNTANGGMLTRAEQFFYNTDAKKRTKHLLRYIVARWGYATHLFAWELFNEVNFTGLHPNQTAQWYPGVKAWHDEMGQYIKSIDAFDHLVTSSSDESHLADFDKLEGLDNVQYHLYNTSLLSTQTAKDKILLTQLSRTGLINGEYGLDVNTADVPFDDQRVSIWTGIMNQVPHLMWKWDNYVNTNWANLFQYPAAFIAEEDFVAEGELNDLQFTATYNTEALGVAGFKTAEGFYGIVYDRIHRNAINTAKADFSKVSAGNYTISYTDIVSGAQSEQTRDFYSERDFSLPAFSKGIAFKAKLNYPLVLSADDQRIVKSLTIYPNPSAQAIQVELYDALHVKQVQVMNVLGVSTTINATSTEKTVLIDLQKSGIQPGINILKIKTISGTYSGRFIYAPTN